MSSWCRRSWATVRHIARSSLGTHVGGRGTTWPRITRSLSRLKFWSTMPTSSLPCPTSTEGPSPPLTPLFEGVTSSSPPPLPATSIEPPSLDALDLLQIVEQRWLEYETVRVMSVPGRIMLHCEGGESDCAEVVFAHYTTLSIFLAKQPPRDIEIALMRGTAMAWSFEIADGMVQ